MASGQAWPKKLKAKIMENSDSDHSTILLASVMPAEVPRSAVLDDAASSPLLYEEEDDTSIVVTQ